MCKKQGGRESLKMTASRVLQLNSKDNVLVALTICGRRAD